MRSPISEIAAGSLGGTSTRPSEASIAYEDDLPSGGLRLIVLGSYEAREPGAVRADQGRVFVR